MQGGWLLAQLSGESQPLFCPQSYDQIEHLAVIYSLMFIVAMIIFFSSFVVKRHAMSSVSGSYLLMLLAVRFVLFPRDDCNRGGLFTEQYTSLIWWLLLLLLVVIGYVIYDFKNRHKHR